MIIPKELRKRIEEKAKEHLGNYDPNTDVAWTKMNDFLAGAEAMYGLMSEPKPEARYLEKGKLLGEDFDQRMSRFGLIAENANSNWDLSDRDESAIRTAEAFLNSLNAERNHLRAENARMREALAEIARVRCAWQLSQEIASKALAGDQTKSEIT